MSTENYKKKNKKTKKKPLQTLKYQWQSTPIHTHLTVADPVCCHFGMHA